MIEKEACIVCGNCVALCPKNILYIDETNKCDVRDEPICDKVRGCERACPTNAIKI